ncbi:hypothetical protein [Nocardiopsis valliformis]|uniref:hypothetical protein n=1 Tax=Nocardiopsis valliformis TaxID=239974 RepID=UPI00034A4F68|nr:hypothetical protein [Nocardiopsis valliformis]
MSYSHSSTPHDGSSSDRSPGSALIAAIFMTLCCNQICGIIAIVFSAIAMSKESEPGEQDRFVGYAWTTMGIGLAISVVLVLFYFLFLGSIS